MRGGVVRFEILTKRSKLLFDGVVVGGAGGGGKEEEAEKSPKPPRVPTLPSPPVNSDFNPSRRSRFCTWVPLAGDWSDWSEECLKDGEAVEK